MRSLSSNPQDSGFAPIIRSLRRVSAKSRTAAFSLVEVTMALGIVSFGVLSIVGVMSIGLNTLKDARGVQTQAAIVAHVRSKLQQMSLTQAGGSNSLSTFVTTPMYFTVEGIPTEAASTDAPYYYKASFSKEDVVLVGSDGPVTLQAQNLQSVRVSISYPPHAATPVTNHIPLLIARQRQ